MHRHSGLVQVLEIKVGNKSHGKALTLGQQCHFYFV